MIEDTCRCGSRFTVKNHSYLGERMAHDKWLDEHSSCRTQTGGVTMNPTDQCQTCGKYLYGLREAKSQNDILYLRGVLNEMRVWLHAQGRRPEECYEMSRIDDALSGTRGRP